MLEEMNINTGIDLDKMIALAKELQLWIGRKTDSALLRAGKVSDLVSISQAKKH